MKKNNTEFNGNGKADHVSVIAITIMTIGALVALCLVSASCSSLEKKSVALATGGGAFSISSSASGSSQSASPSIVFGSSSVCLSTSVPFKDSDRAVPTFSYRRSSSFWGSVWGMDISTETMTYTGVVNESAEETKARLSAFKSLYKNGVDNE